MVVKLPFKLPVETLEGMELHVVSTEGIPEGCVLSVRAGTTRRQAPVAADRPFRFPTQVHEATPFKVDILEPIASARLIFRPGEERRTDCQYHIPLEPASEPQDAPFKDQEEEDRRKAQADPAMAVTVAVKPSEEKGDDDKANAGDGDNPGDASRPASSTRNRRSASSSSSSRHGQASAAREYLDQHNLVEFTQLLVQSVIKEQPERPYSFMARQFFFPEPQPRTAGVAAAPDSANQGKAGATAADRTAP